MPPIISTQQVSFVYGQGTPFERKALDNIDLTIDKGEFLGIIGHTGSGKSTLIQHFNGLIKPNSGKILFDSRDIWQSPKEIRKIRFKVGLVFQYPEHQLFEETVFDDIAFGPRNMGLAGPEVEERVRDSLAMVGLDEECRGKSPFELSGGQKRRVAIAGVMAMNPDVLILDEPTAGLDPQGCTEIMSKVRDYREQKGGTVVLVTHNMEEIACWVDRIAVMSQARIVAVGTPREISAKADMLEAIGLDVPQVTRVMLKLREMGLDIDSSAFTVEQAAERILACLE